MKRYPRADKQIVLNAESIAEAVDVTARMYVNTIMQDLQWLDKEDTLVRLFNWYDTVEGYYFWECYHNNFSLREENE